MPFQKSVNINPPLGRSGDIASSAPMRTLTIGESQPIADAAGVTVGIFAFVDQNTGKAKNAQTTAGDLVGFVHNEQRGLITDWMAESSLKLFEGQPVGMATQGEFYVAFTTAVTPGMVVGADTAIGAPKAGATLPAGCAATRFKVNTKTPIGDLAVISSWS